MGRWVTGLLALSVVSAAHATWSIILIDTATKEIVVGSATCVSNIDLEQDLPVVRVGVGAACAQSAVDQSGRNRRVIWNAFQAGTDPNEILNLLEAQDTGHQTRQYGIVDVHGRAATFSGSENGDYKNGLTGRFGDLVYSIQGNVITGQPVLDMAEQAIITTPGALPEKVIAAMEAAASMGGDGRCSCDTLRPDRCGSPPPDFDRTSWVSFMIGARRGDTDGTRCTGSAGCATGDYYLNVNVTRSVQADAVVRLRTKYDRWRDGLVGVPDAVESSAALGVRHMLNDGASQTTLRIEARDWQGAAVTNLDGIRVIHNLSEGSAGSSTIGDISDLGNGMFELPITAGTTAGRDRFLVALFFTGDNGAESVFLIQDAELYIQDARADFNGDDVVDLADLSIQLQAFGAGNGGDVDGDNDTDLTDLALLLGSFLPS